MFFAESQIIFVPMMPLLKIRDVSGQARFLVSANSLNELKAKGKHHFLLNYFWLVFIKQSVKETKFKLVCIVTFILNLFSLLLLQAWCRWPVTLSEKGRRLNLIKFVRFLSSLRHFFIKNSDLSSVIYHLSSV